MFALARRSPFASSLRVEGLEDRLAPALLGLSLGANTSLQLGGLTVGVTVGSSGPTGGGTQSLPPAQPSGSIGGTVYDGNGSPIVGALVFVDANGNGVADTGEKSAYTDDGGRYALSGLAASSGAGYSVVAVNQSVTASHTVTLADGEHKTGQDFVLSDGSGGTGGPPQT